MIWKERLELVGKHAFLSPSRKNWHSWDDETLLTRRRGYYAKYRGTELHEHAAADIIFGQKYGIMRPRSKTTYNMYVNDAIAYRMRTEQPLYFSPDAFGTADAISFNRNVLRIHDLKTGKTPADMGQLVDYAALFCLDYRHDPHTIHFKLRIYQNNKIFEYEPTGDEVQASIDDYVHKTKVLADHSFDFEV